MFVNSMSDLFHEAIRDDYAALVAQVMADANWHVYQVLSKRSDRMRQLLRTDLRFAARSSHIWWGVSVENRRHGLPRIEHLRDANPAVAFLSIEPLLEDLGEIDLRGIDWVIVGGESGVRARPMKTEWVLNIKEQCLSAGIPFFFKQWGGLQKGKNGRKLEGRTYDDLHDRPRNSVPDPDARRRLLAKYAEAWPSVSRDLKKQTA
jgi:protein gp37